MARYTSGPEGQTVPPSIRKLLSLVAVSFVLWQGTLSLRAQEVVAEPNLQVFAVMAALHAAGYEPGADRGAGAPGRAALRQELAAKDVPSREALREFYRSHRLADPARDLGQYVSLALLLSGPPKFELQLSPVNLPPEALDLREMVPLIAAFYEQARIADLWEKYLPAMEEESDRYRVFLARAIQEINGYLRIDTSHFGRRRFALYLNPLGAANQTNARSYGDDYFVVIGPSAEIPEGEIRHGWLHFLLDPYALRYPRTVESKSELQKILQRAPAVEDSFRGSFSLLLSESLIRAIQARRMGGDAENKKRAVQEAVEEGFYLAAYFSEALDAFEQQPVGMYLYYPEMVDGISVKREQERVAQVHFRARVESGRQEARWSPAEEMLRQGEEKIARGEYDQARRVFEELSQTYGPHARASYGLAVVASQKGQRQAAKQYFTEAINRGTDPHVTAWSNIYLGRLLDLEGEREAARVHYTAALNAGDPADDTRAAAEAGLRESFALQGRTGVSPVQPQKEEPPRRRVPLGREDR